MIHPLDGVGGVDVKRVYCAPRVVEFKGLLPGRECSVVIGASFATDPHIFSVSRTPLSTDWKSSFSNLFSVQNLQRPYWILLKRIDSKKSADILRTLKVLARFFVIQTEMNRNTHSWLKVMCTSQGYFAFYFRKLVFFSLLY